MKNIDRTYFAALDRRAAALQKVWLREREEQRAMQLAANAEVRRRWIETDSQEGEATSDAERGKETDHDSRNSSG